MHPKVEHRMTLVWIMGYQDMAERIKDYFCDETLIKFPPGCRVIIPSPGEKLLKEYDLEGPAWFDVPNYESFP